MTMTLVSTVTVGAGGAASISFTGIPQTGTDLLVLFSARETTNASEHAQGTLRFNGDTGANYSARYLRGDGSTVASSAPTAIFVPAVGQNATASTFGNSAVYIPNYAGASTKSVSVDGTGENNATSNRTWIIAGLWNSTAAVTSLSITGTTNWAQYSTASLYTITKGSGGASVA